MRAAAGGGEEPTALQRVLIAADLGQRRERGARLARAPVHQHRPKRHPPRPPEGEWVCLEAETLLGPLGLADTALWDERGRIGRAAQTLLVRPRD